MAEGDQPSLLDRLLRRSRTEETDVSDDIRERQDQEQRSVDVGSTTTGRPGDGSPPIRSDGIGVVDDVSKDDPGDDDDTMSGGELAGLLGDPPALPDDTPDGLAFGRGAGGPAPHGLEADQGFAADVDAPFEPVAHVAPSGLGLDGPQPDGLEPTDAGVDPVPDTVLVDDTADHSDPTDLPID